MLKPVAAWLAILLLAVANGALREALLVPNLPKPIAYVASGAILSGCVLAVAFALAPWMDLRGTRRCLAVGALWLGLTLAFEFGFGGIVQRQSWNDMLAQYTLRDGNLWPIVLAITFFAPLIAFRGRHLR